MRLVYSLLLVDFFNEYTIPNTPNLKDHTHTHVLDYGCSILYMYQYYKHLR